MELDCFRSDRGCEWDALWVRYGSAICKFVVLFA